VARLIDLRRVPRAEADAVLDQVVALDARIFEHRSEQIRERFYRGMRDLSSADKLVVLYEEGTEIVGYNLIKIHPLEVGTQTVWVVGSVAGFLPGHTGGNRSMPDAIRAMLGYKLRHPGRAFFFVSFLLNPGGYGMLADLCPATFPSVHRPRPRGIEPALIAAAARAWGIEVLSDDPARFIATTGRVCREPFERRRDSEHIRFYERLNPRHAEGELLGVCVPLDFEHLLSGVFRLLLRRRRKRLAPKHHPQ
jgi:hypothetical protein